MKYLRPETFLESYVKELAGQDTTDLRQLVLAEGVHHRVRYPLVLWAALTERLEYLKRLVTPGSPLAQETDRFLALEGREAVLAEAERDGLLELGRGYWKAWNAYLVKANEPERDAWLKDVVRRRLRTLMEENDTTVGQLAESAKLDPNSLRAFLTEKKNCLTLDDARRARDLVAGGKQ